MTTPRVFGRFALARDLSRLRGSRPMGGAAGKSFPPMNFGGGAAENPHLDRQGRQEGAMATARPSSSSSIFHRAPTAHKAIPATNHRRILVVFPRTCRHTRKNGSPLATSLARGRPRQLTRKVTFAKMCHGLPASSSARF